MKITLGKEKCISQAPVSISTSEWGPWQFPRIFDAGDRIYLKFHIASDSALSYGKPKAWFYSDDKGDTWHRCDNGGMLLDNGDIIKPHQKPAVPEQNVTLPEVIGTFYGYGFKREYFDYAKVAEEYKHWYIERTSPGKPMEVEEVSVELPNYTMNTSEGVFPTPYFHQIKKGPGGSLWTFLYKHYLKPDGSISEYSASWFHRSTDNGKTWEYMGMVPYEFDLEKDPGAAKRYGFGEPDMCFVSESKAFALHRTTDGTGIGPLYITWTDDEGRTWTKPEYFDDRGVWPQTISLENGIILAGYGRTGLFIRPFCNGEWFDRIAVVEPSEYQSETCSYCALLATGSDTAIIVYSDFNYPDENGIPRKSIMVRKIHTEA